MYTKFPWTKFPWNCLLKIVASIVKAGGNNVIFFQYHYGDIMPTRHTIYVWLYRCLLTAVKSIYALQQQQYVIHLGEKLHGVVSFIPAGSNHFGTTTWEDVWHTIRRKVGFSRRAQQLFTSLLHVFNEARLLLKLPHWTAIKQFVAHSTIKQSADQVTIFQNQESR